MNGQVVTGNGNVERGSLRVDEAERLRRNILREDDEGFWNG